MAIKKSSGVQDVGAKILIYGPQGIGKSTLALGLPDPVVVDPNFGTSKLNVSSRYDIETWDDLEEVTKLIHKEPPGTLIVDEFCDLEQRLYESVAKANHCDHISEVGTYGAGYREAMNRLKNVIGMWEKLTHQGTNVVVVGHSRLDTFSNPEGHDYNRFVLDVRETVGKILSRNFDAVLFCKYEVDVKVERKGFDVSTKGVTGDRVMCTEWDAVYDAKNRFGMRSVEPLESKRLLGYLEASKMSRESLTEVLSGHKLFKEDMTTRGMRQLYAHQKSTS